MAYTLYFSGLNKGVRGEDIEDFLCSGQFGNPAIHNRVKCRGSEATVVISGLQDYYFEQLLKPNAFPNATITVQGPGQLVNFNYGQPVGPGAMAYPVHPQQMQGQPTQWGQPQFGGLHSSPASSVQSPPASFGQQGTGDRPHFRPHDRRSHSVQLDPMSPPGQDGYGTPYGHQGLQSGSHETPSHQESKSSNSQSDLKLDLAALLDQIDNSSIVKVTDLELEESDVDTIDDVFSNDDEGGGEVVDIDIAQLNEKGFILISFKDPGVAKQVCKKKQWRVMGQTAMVSLYQEDNNAIKKLLTVARKHSQHAIIIENLPDSERDADVTLRLEKITKLDLEYSTTEKYEHVGTKALLVLSDGDPDFKDSIVSKINDYSKSPKAHKDFAQISALNFPQVKKVIITGVKDEMCHEHKLQPYFANRKKSGGGPGCSVEVVDRGRAVVSFKQSAHADSTLEIDHEKTLGEGVTVQPYHPLFEGWLSESAAAKDTHEQQDFDCEVQSELKCAYLTKNSHHLNEFNNRLRENCAIVKLDAAQKVFHVKPRQGSQFIEEWKDKCTKCIEEFLESYREDMVSIPEGTSGAAFKLLFTVAKDNPLVDFNDSQAESVSVVGPAADVATVVERLQRVVNESMDVNEVVKFAPAVLHYVHNHARKKLKEKHPQVDFKASLQEGCIEVIGKTAKCEEFIEALKKIKPSSARVNISPDAVHLLASPVGREYILDKMPEQVEMSHFFTDENDALEDAQMAIYVNLYIVADSSLSAQVRQVAKDIESSLCTKQIDVPKEFQHTVRSQAWNDFKQGVEQRCVAQLLPHAADPLVVICDHQLIEQLAQKIQSFVQENCYTKETVTFGSGQWRFFFEYSKEWTIIENDIKKTCEYNCVEEGRSTAIHLQGETTPSKTLAKKVRNLRDSICTDKMEVSRPGLVDHFSSEEGRMHIKGIAAARRAVVEVSTAEENEHVTEMIAQEKKHPVLISGTLADGVIVEVRKGDLTEFEVDVIVNAANEQLNHGGGVAGQIRSKGGLIIQDESDQYVRRNGSVDIGKAVILKVTGDLPCKSIVHAVGPRWRGGNYNESHLLARAISASLTETVKKGFTSIAFPAIGAGIFGVPIEVCAKAMFEGLCSFFSMSNHQMKVIIMVYQQEHVEPFISAARKSLNDVVQPKEHVMTEHPSGTAPMARRASSHTMASAITTDLEISHGSLLDYHDWNDGHFLSLHNGARDTSSSPSEINPGRSKSNEILKSIPKRSRHRICNELITIFKNICQTNNEDSWQSLFLFPRKCLACPKRGGCSRTVSDSNAHTQQNVVPRKSYGARVASKLEERDFAGAVRLATSKTSLAPENFHTQRKLEEKLTRAHSSNAPILPRLVLNSNLKAALDISPSLVLKAIYSFPSGSAGGPDGLRPQHLKDILFTVEKDYACNFMQSLTSFVNLVAQGYVPLFACPFFFGASLIGLTESDAEMKPIAVGCTLRRLVAKCCAYIIKQKMGLLLAPGQLGYGTNRGREAIVHAARIYLSKMDKENLFLKLFFNNSFNSIRRDSMLLAVLKLSPIMYPLVHSAYARPTNLYFDDEVIVKSEEGVQQGDPLSPLLFCLTTHKLTAKLRSEFHTFYLDNGALGGCLQDILADMQFIEVAAANLGLSLNRSRCELITNSQSITRSMLRIHPDLISIMPADAVLLGAPIGGLPSINSVLEAINDTLRIMGARLASLPSHDALCLLRHAFTMPKLLHVLRTAPSFMSASLKSFDIQQRTLLETICNITLSNSCWLQASLPISSGGLGIRSTTMLAPSAFLASFAGCSTIISSLLPQSMSSLSDPVAKGALHTWQKQTSVDPPSAMYAHKQKCWDELVTEAAFATLLQSSTSTNQARLLDIKEKKSSTWLTVAPISSIDLRMDEDNVRIATSLHLGFPLCSHPGCPNCGKHVLDETVLHDLLHHRGRGRISWLSELNHIAQKTLIDVHCSSAAGRSVIETQIQHGSLTDVVTDVYVDTTSADLDLKSRPVSKALLQAGGQALQDECTKHVQQNGKVPAWSFATTGPGTLKCKHVLHTVASDYDGPGGSAEKGMETMITNVMKECDRLKASTVAFPSIGTGALGFPHNIAADIMITTVSTYLSQHRATAIKKVLFVIFDQPVLKAYKAKKATLPAVQPQLSSASSSTRTHPSACSRGSNTPTVKLSNLSFQPQPTRPVIGTQIQQGSLTDVVTDVYVDTTSPDLDLKSRPVSKALLKAGGPALQDECTKHVQQNGNVPAWSFATTGPGTLKCKHVLHTVAAEYDGPGGSAEKGLEQMMMDMLTECDNLKATTVAIPSIGAGNLKFPPDVVARIMIQSVSNYGQKNSGTVLKSVTFAIFDNTVLQCFQSMHSRLSSSPAAMPRLTSQAGAKVSPCITIQQGSLTNVVADVYVDTTSADLDLKSRPVSKVLLQAGGQALQDECTRHVQQNGKVPAWSFATTGPGALKCKHVLHTVASDYDGPGGSAEKGMEDMLHRVLEECDRLKATSVAIPSIGAGNFKFPPSVLASLMLRTVSSYFNKNRNSTVTKVLFVIFDGNLLKEFQEAQSGSPQTHPAKKSKSSAAARSNECTLQCNNLRVSIVHGDITKETSEAIVNTAPDDLEFNNFGVQGAFLRMGGPELQAECRAVVQNEGRLSGNKIRVTSPGRMGGLKCRQVLHILAPKTPVKLKGTVKAILNQVNKLGLRTVALPAIGTGQHGFKTDQAAKHICEAIVEFSKHPNTLLREVRIVLFDKSLCSDFCTKFQSNGERLGVWAAIKGHFFNAADAMGKRLGAANDSRDDSASDDEEDTNQSFTEQLSDQFSSMSLHQPYRESSYLVLSVYAQTKEIVSTVIKELHAVVDKELVTEPVQEDLIQELSDDDVAMLHQRAGDLQVELDLDGREVGSVTIKGAKTNVGKTKLFLKEILHKIEMNQTAEQFEVERAKKEEQEMEKQSNLAALVFRWQRIISGQCEDFPLDVSFFIEQARLDNQPACRIPGEAGEEYEIDFANMTIRDRSGNSGEVCRFDFEEDRKKAQKQLAEGGHFVYPTHWEPMPVDSKGREAVFHPVVLSANDQEYKEVLQDFEKTMTTQFNPTGMSHYTNILAIKRIQNPTLYSTYVTRKTVMEKANPNGTQNERRLFHGCAFDSAANICQTGFNKSFCGRNATAIGKGSYFAVNASYSAIDTYSPRNNNDNGRKHVFFARVLTGEFTQGHASFQDPPSKDAQSKFDSVVNNPASPAMYVVFYDTQAYPDYLIEFN